MFYSIEEKRICNTALQFLSVFRPWLTTTYNNKTRTDSYISHFSNTVRIIYLPLIP